MPAATQALYNATSLPINMTGKSHHISPAVYRQTSVSPPEVADSITTSGRSSAVPSYSNSGTSSASGDYDSAKGVDLMELLNDRLSATIDPLPLDRAVVTQAQTSGALNAKQRELLALQAEAQRRLAATRANFADGMKAAKEVKKDLEWTQKRVSALNAKAEKKYPAQYKKAQARYPAPGDI